jgi:hypothetical protein
LQFPKFGAKSRSLHGAKGILHHRAQRLILVAGYSLSLCGKIRGQGDGFFDRLTHNLSSKQSGGRNYHQGNCGASAPQ